MGESVIDKIHICIKEIQMMRQLLDERVADDFCVRLLAIYVMMRIDDITKLWSHNVEKDSPERKVVENVKKQYNELRDVRNKLGAHYQKVDGKHFLFEMVQLFRSLDYANVVCLIDDVIEAQSKIEDVKIEIAGFDYLQDIDKAVQILDALYMDDKACVTNGALDVFGINKGFLMSTTEAQVKGQHLRSIEQMINFAAKLMDTDYQDPDVLRMFKRLYVSLVYNYHDNLMTRTDIKADAVQYEDGFDKLFLSLISKNDNRQMLEGAFDNFEKQYGIDNYITEHRSVRNHACAHLDKDMTIQAINAELDAFDIDELKNIYSKMLSMFNFICRNTFTLKMQFLPPRTVLYDAQLQNISGVTDFYGEEQSIGDFPKAMTCKEIMRSIRKKDGRYGEACDAFLKRLMSENGLVYQEMIDEVSSRMREHNLDKDELNTIINMLHNAVRGYPERLQQSVVAMIGDEKISKKYNVCLLWLLSNVCIEDKNLNMRGRLSLLISQNIPVLTAFALLALLHLTVQKNYKCFASQNTAHDVEQEFISYLDNIHNPADKCAIMLALIQHWYQDTSYCTYRRYETKYTKFFDKEMEKALDEYFRHLRNKYNDEEQLCKKYLSSRRYLLLLQILACIEKARNLTPNIFLEMWQCNCFVRFKDDVHEGLACAILTEMTGDKLLAKNMLEDIINIYPISKDASDTFEDFKKRNPEI